MRNRKRRFNRLRAKSAYEMLQGKDAPDFSDDIDSALRDAIANCLHLAALAGMDTDELLQRALASYDGDKEDAPHNEWNRSLFPDMGNTAFGYDPDCDEPLNLKTRLRIHKALKGRSNVA